MSDTKRFDNITDAEMKAKGVVSLALRPNMPSQYGQGGLTGKQLQERFDRLARYIVEKYNILVDGLASHDVLDYFKLPEGYSLDSLNELVERISDSHGDLVVKSPYTEKYEKVADILAQMKLEILNGTGIIDVDALPTTDIVPTIIYRYEGILYHYDETDKAWRIFADTSYVDEKVQDERTRALSAEDLLNADVTEAKRIAKGANQAVSFPNYYQMINALNTMPEDTYNKGQSILIGARDVPDLWVYSKNSFNKPYTFTSNEDFIDELNKNLWVWVGHYQLAALETQKVDLSEYVQAYIGKRGTINRDTSTPYLVELEFEVGGYSGFGQAYLSTEQTFTRNQFVGGTATINNNYGGALKTISITGSMIQEETSDGICVVLRDSVYSFACIISAYTTNYQPSFAKTPCPAVGTYLSYWSYYDTEWVESINVEVVPTKYINNALIDLRNHPDYPSIPETPSAPAEATKLYKHSVYINSGNIGVYADEAKIYLSYVSTSATPITTLDELAKSPACVSQGTSYWVNYTYAVYDYVDAPDGQRDVRNILISGTKVYIHYIDSYTLPATTRSTTHQDGVNYKRVLITDTVTEV